MVESVDVCIVGAGAAGITLACELDGCGLKVLLLEAGGLASASGDADIYRGTTTHPHPETTEYRRSAFGGTTSLWGGRCVALDPLDFERRDYVPNSGWPIAYREVEQHYPRALAYCDAGKFDFSVVGSIARPAPTIEGFDGAAMILADRIERYSLPTDFGKRYRGKIAQSANVTALLHARCVRLHKRSGDDAIESVEIVDLARRRVHVSSRVVVLAAGGIEVPRLLLASDRDGSGLGNRHDLLGRFYSCHFENTCGRLSSNGKPVVFDFEKTEDGIYCRRQLRFSEEAQLRHRLLNMVFRLHFPEYSDASHGSAVMSAIYLARSSLPSEYRSILRHGKQMSTVPLLPHVQNVLRGLAPLTRFSCQWLFKIQLARRKLPYTLVPNADGSFPLEFNSEQTPNASNRVSLAAEADQDGMQRVHVNWRIGDSDVESACRGFGLLRDTINSGSSCRLEFDEQRLRDQITSSPPLGGHHIGTTRMGGSERCGVVDADCAVYGLPNLFVASSAVFPTSGYANPTLTIVAMALRLARHIRSHLSSGCTSRPDDGLT